LLKATDLQNQPAIWTRINNTTYRSTKRAHQSGNHGRVVLDFVERSE
jgi:hypothetical protein